MKWPAMGYARVESLDDLWRALDAAGPEAQILAGGQSLLATLAFRLSAPSTLIDITASPRSRACPSRRMCCGSVPSPAMLILPAIPLSPATRRCWPRPRRSSPIPPSATVARSAAAWRWPTRPQSCRPASSPSGRRWSSPPAPASAGSRPPTSSRGSSRPRWTPARSSPPSRCRGHRPSRQTIVEVTRRSGDYAMAGLAAALDVDGGVVTSARLVFFGIGSGAEVARGASSALTGKPLSPETIAAAQAALAVDLDPPTDLHGGPEMKRHLARVLTRRALTAFLVPSEQAA